MDNEKKETERERKGRERGREGERDGLKKGYETQYEFIIYLPARDRPWLQRPKTNLSGS